MSQLKRLREKAGLSQSEVAEAMGYESGQFISNWERGISHPPIKDIRKLAKIYKIDADYLFSTVRDVIFIKFGTKLEKQYRGR